MIDTALLENIAAQLMQQKEIAVGSQVEPVKRSSFHHLRMVKFKMNGKEYQAIEQNPDKPSRWGELARAGHKVIQFREVASGQYIAVSVDGKVKEYSR